ncbi:MAG TPA: DUF4363 family protein [Bacillota bacterium]|nr:DUF4363 family protein [Bacillota bacterium]HPT86756.1 DUF4363 family protein [Bacillota bacterium]
MKPWYIIILGVGLFILFGYSTQTYLNTSSQRLNHQLLSVQSALSENHWEEAARLMKTFEQDWSGTRKLWALLTHHEEIDNVDQSLTKTREAIKGRSLSDAQIEIETLRHFIKHIAERERLSLVNIL